MPVATACLGELVRAMHAYASATIRAQSKRPSMQAFVCVVSHCLCCLCMWYVQHSCGAFGNIMYVATGCRRAGGVRKPRLLPRTVFENCVLRRATCAGVGARAIKRATNATHDGCNAIRRLPVGMTARAGRVGRIWKRVVGPSGRANLCNRKPAQSKSPRLGR